MAATNPAQTILSAKIEAKDTVKVVFSQIPKGITRDAFRIFPNIAIKDLKFHKKTAILITSPFDVSKTYEIEIRNIGRKELQPDGILDEFVSTKPLGCQVDSDKTVFRVFAPRATRVNLVLFNRHDEEQGQEYQMLKDDQGVWEYRLPGRHTGRYYGYKVAGPKSKTEMYDPTKVIADPYSRAVVTQNHYLHPGKTLILDTSNYDWEGDRWMAMDMEDLIIYEMHVRDLTAHESSGVSPEKRGTYLGLIERNCIGGIDYIKDLGVNAIELLPCQDFGNMEVPYKDSTAPVYNTWNPYARNHWGYMTSYFFAPESYYATGGTMIPGQYNGIDGRQVREFKDLVKAFHKEGLAVIMDVVYNHVSEYDQNCFKYIDKKYYFRLDNDQNFLAKSYCGNDFKTERPMSRRLILDSITFWMTEYHIDGFRFDLATMIDWKTCEKIIEEAKKINPKVIIIAEPWGGGKYDLAGFSKRGWAAWNDQFRNGVKGQNPHDGLGFIFGHWQGPNSLETMKSYIRGSLVQDGGPFVTAAHSINYLESHDDHTLGDFIRIGSGEVDINQVILKTPGSEEDLDHHAQLSQKQMKLNKLAALILFTSQGPVMIHEGQEFARSKVIAHTDVPDTDAGKIDHNSYNKDNQTNWLNFRHRELNIDLVNYYKGLIALRKAHPAFRRSHRDDIQFLDCDTPFAFGYLIKRNSSDDTNDFLVLLNGNPQRKATFLLPEGQWAIAVDGKKVRPEPFQEKIIGTVTLEPTSGMVLLRF